MKIKNKSIKIIGVNGQAVMPEGEIVVPNAMKDNPSIKVMAELGYIAIELDKDEPKAEPVEEITEVAEPTEVDDTEEAPKKRTRGKKASE